MVCGHTHIFETPRWIILRRERDLWASVSSARFRNSAKREDPIIEHENRVPAEIDSLVAQLIDGDVGICVPTNSKCEDKPPAIVEQRIGLDGRIVAPDDFIGH